MDATIRKVLVWKERSMLWGIAIGLIAITLIVFLSTLVLQNNIGPEAMAGQFFGITMAFGVLTALAMGSLLFAPEREAGTDQWIESLPVSGSEIARAKVAEATKFFLLTWLAIGVMALVFFFFGYGQFSVEMYEESTALQVAKLALWLCVPVQCFLWSLLASIRCGKSIPALLVASAFSFAGALLAAFWFEILGIRVSGKDEMGYILAGNLVLIAFLSILLLNWAPKWLRNRTEMTTLSSLASTANPFGIVATASDSRPGNVRASQPMRVLMWETWRTRKWVLIVASIICLCLTIGGLFIPLAVGIEQGDLSELVRNFSFPAAILLGMLAGMSAFGGDQAQKQFRFFQQYADYPRQLWCARMSVIAVIGVMFFLALSFGLLNVAKVTQLTSWFDQTTNYFVNGYYGGVETFPNAGLTLWRPLFLFIATAGFAQLFSIFFRSGILMFISAAGFSAFAAWPLIYLTWLNEPLWIFGGPLVVASFLASFLYSTYWLREKRLWTSVSISAVVLIGISIGTVFGLRHHRLNEVQPLAMFDDMRALHAGQDKHLRANSKKFQAALDLEAALKKLKPISEQNNGLELYTESPEERIELIEKNRTAIDELIKALKNENARYATSAYSPITENRQVSTINRLLEIEFDYQMNRGDFDMALEAAVASVNAVNLELETISGATKWANNFIRWSEAEGQTAEKIAVGQNSLSLAIENLCAIESNKFFERAYLIALRNRESWKIDSLGNQKYGDRSMFFNVRFSPPWEAERSMRLIEHSLKASAESRLSIWKDFCGRCLSVTDELNTNIAETYFYRRTIYLDDPELLKKFDHTVFDFEKQLVISPRYFSTKIRYVKLRMALAAYRADNDQYPDRLVDLMPKYLDELPVAGDGREFAYSPIGADLPLVFTATFNDPYQYRPGYRSNRLWECEDFVPADRPFLLPWSGIIEAKRDFIYKRPDDFEDDFDRQDLAEGRQNRPDVDRQIGYWLPTDWAANLFGLPPKDKPGQNYILGEFGQAENP